MTVHYIRILIAKLRWAEAHGDVLGAYLIRQKLDRVS
jgi:hypothetical protein